MKQRPALVLGILLLACAFAGRAATSTQVRLLLSAASARPDDTVLAGVQLRMAPGWHTYWRYGGESGGPTTVKWTLPDGVTAGEIQWPVPEKLTQDGLTTYVYHNEIMLLVPLKLAANLASGPLELKAKISWLECEKLCVPGKGEVSATLAIGAETKPSADAPAIEAAKKKLPQSGEPPAAKATWDGTANDDPRALVIEWSAPAGVKEADFYPYGSDNFEVQPATERFPDDGGKIRLRKKVKKIEGNWPAEIAGILVQRDGADKAGAHEVQLKPGSAGASAGGPAGSRSSLGWMLLLAFIGGLILNIMPCVLPVIALKILGFVNQSREAPQRVRRLGLIYGAGVLASFLVLALLVIGVQQAGRSASWGMQFQNPQFLVVITTLVTLVALNLFGLFEVTLGSRAMGAAGELAGKEGAAGAFFNGVLATALATPCTAPFLGVALGFAFAQPAAVIVLMFLTVGAGLAFPYVLLSWQPAWLKFLPRPGLWMQRFKIAMGFPMLATAVWLFTLAGKHYGGRALWLGLFLVLVALAAWIFGEFAQRGGRQRGLALAISVLLLLAAYGYAVEGQLRWRAPQTEADTGGSLQESPDGIVWQRWSAEAVIKARSAGRPVLVDFTADWCVTCQANKKTSIETASVRAKLKEINAVSLLGDYTREDAAIAAELRKFNRAGVPLVLVYPKDSNAPPLVLPELLTPGIMLEALEKAAK